MIGESTYNPLQSINEFRNNKALYKKVLRIAQFQSEVDLGVNPKNSDQADVSSLSEVDFGYINKVCKLVETRLNDTKWLIKTIHEIKNKFKPTPESKRGVRYNDELYKPGRGILENYLKKLEGKKHS